MRVLEASTRVHTIDGGVSFAEQTQYHRVHLPWGTALIVIMGSADDTLLDELHQARRGGQSAS